MAKTSVLSPPLASTLRRMPEAALAKAREEWVAIAICALALALRLWGINFSLPYAYHPDEPVVSNTLVRMMLGGTANPASFTYPSGLYYIFACVFFVYQIFAGHPVSIAHTMTGIGVYPDPNAILLTRIVVALMGVAAVLVVYRAARLFVGMWPAAGGAVLLAISTSFVLQSQVATTDLPAAAGLALAAGCCVIAVRVDRPAPFWFAGVALGLAAGLKYNVGSGVVMLAVAYGIVTWRRLRQPNAAPWQSLWRDPRLLGFLLVPITFFITTPFALHDVNKFVSDVVAVQRHYDVEGHPGAQGDTLGYTLSQMFLSPEAVLSVLALIGVVHAFVKRRVEGIVVFAGAAVYFVVIATPKVHFDRNLVPLWPLLAILAAEGLLGIVEGLGRVTPRLTRLPEALRSQSRQSVFVAVLFVISLAPTLAPSIVADTLRTSTDIRTTATQWVQANVPVGTSIAIEPYTVTLDSATYNVTYVACGLFMEPASWYVSHNVEYVVASSINYARYVDSTSYPLQRAGYLDLFSQWQVVQKWVGIDTVSATTGNTIMLLRVEPPTGPQPPSQNETGVVCPQ